MASAIGSGLSVLFTVIAVILAATAIASTNAAVVGSLAWIVLGFVPVLIAVKALKG